MPTSTTNGSRSRSSSTARNEVLEMLKEDHKKAKKAFRDFEKLDAEQDADACAAIVQQTCAELTLHATLEEECFYPAVRQALADDADLLDEAEVEHQSAKDLIEKLQGMQPGDAKFAASFTVLGEYVAHHVKEEESEMFPKLTRAKIDWDALSDQMSARRAELEEQLLPEPAEDEQGTRGTTTRASASTRGASAGRRSAGESARPQAADDEEKE